MDGPVLKPMVEAVTRVFGLSARHYLRLVKRAWGGVTRESGHFEYIVNHPTQTELVWHNAPNCVATNETYVNGFAAFWLGVLDVLQSEGSVEIPERAPTARTVRFVVSWS